MRRDYTDAKYRKERGADWCRHRTAFDRDEFPVCKVGIAYHTLHKDVMRLPCLGEESQRCLCSKYEPYTQQELEQEDREIDAHFDGIVKARDAILETGFDSHTGTMGCPVCGIGTLSFSVIRNYRKVLVSASCSVAGCVRWVE